ncbi:hypothetical protein GALL_433510 [mine drainage metagenome]|uniref:Uncharacterized protein n=1 Tax=mine drainage metagenome TaxID=410659 RepID=A0A1J5PU41_9ZZZZ
MTERAQCPVELYKILLRSFALGDVTDEADRVPFVGQHHGRKGQLDRKFIAVFSLCRELERLADRRPFAGGPEGVQALAVVVVVANRCEQCVQIRADGILSGVTEDLLGRQIPVSNLPLIVHDDEGILRGGGDAAELLLAILQRGSFFEHLLLQVLVEVVQRLLGRRQLAVL